MGHSVERRKIIHIDMDCFYAAIEIRDNPSLQDKPVAVGGDANRRGVLCTCNYIARKKGIRSAMATGYAQALCPDLRVIPVNMAKYREISLQIRDIFYEYTSLVEPLSLDEAYLDVTHCNDEKNSATRIAAVIRQKILQRCGLTASAGIAPNKLLAKIASDWHKPNGQLTITPDQVSEFINQLPITKLYGVGKVTARKIHQMNIVTCAELQRFSLLELVDQFGRFGERLYDMCRGVDNRSVQTDRVRKSVSVEQTFAVDRVSLSDCLDQLPSLMEKLVKRLANHQDRVVHKQFVKVRFADFQQSTAETTVTSLSYDIFEKLLCTVHDRQQKPVRLLGVGVGFREAKPQSGEQQVFQW